MGKRFLQGHEVDVHQDVLTTLLLSHSKNLNCKWPDKIFNGASFPVVKAVNAKYYDLTLYVEEIGRKEFEADKLKPESIQLYEHIVTKMMPYHHALFVKNFDPQSSEVTCINSHGKKNKEPKFFIGEAVKFYRIFCSVTEIQNPNQSTVVANGSSNQVSQYASTNMIATPIQLPATPTAIPLQTSVSGVDRCKKQRPMRDLKNMNGLSKTNISVSSIRSGLRASNKNVRSENRDAKLNEKRGINSGLKTNDNKTKSMAHLLVDKENICCGLQIKGHGYSTKSKTHLLAPSPRGSRMDLDEAGKAMRKSCRTNHLGDKVVSALRFKFGKKEKDEVVRVLHGKNDQHFLISLNVGKNLLGVHVYDSDTKMILKHVNTDAIKIKPKFNSKTKNAVKRMTEGMAGKVERARKIFF